MSKIWLWPGRTDAEYVECVRKNSTGWRRKLVIGVLAGATIVWLGALLYGIYLLPRAVDVASSLLTPFYEDDVDGTKKVLSDFMWFVGVVGAFVGASLYMTANLVVMILSYSFDRRSELLVKYYDLVEGTGITEEMPGDRTEGNDVKSG